MSASSCHRVGAFDLTGRVVRLHVSPTRRRCLSPLPDPSSSRAARPALTRNFGSTSSGIDFDTAGQATSTSPAASSSRSSAYVARYRTLSPVRQPLMGPQQPHAVHAHTYTSANAAAVSHNASQGKHGGGSSADGTGSTTSDPAPGSAQHDGPHLESSWAFGGGTKSQGGPAFVGKQDDGAEIPGRSSPLIVMGSAGKGAVPNYGKRKSSSTSLACAATSAEAAHIKSYAHSYSPSTRSEQPLPQHVYFSSPSSSFNASSFVAPGVQPPLGGTTTAGAGQGYPGSSNIVRKRTALILPGQGSQYVAMSKDLYRAFRSARTVWHQAEEALMLTPSQHVHHPPSDERAVDTEQRAAFEAELQKSDHLDTKRGLSASGTAVARGRRGWLRDLVFSGDQLELTRAENAQPAILTCTLAFLQVLRKEFAIDLVQDHVEWAAGHGSGVYAALVGSGAVGLSDAVRLLRHRGLIASHYTANNPTLFPPGCERPQSVYETWAFANAGSGKGAELLAAGGGIDTGGVPSTGLRTDAQVARAESAKQGDATDAGAAPRRRGWKRTQMSGVVVKPGKLDAVLREVQQVAHDIRSGKVSSVASDEVVEVANVNSQLQIVLSGSRVGVSYCCDRLRSKNLGARAVNLPVSGAYHTSLMEDASEDLKPAIRHLPLRDPHGFNLVSSMDGTVLSDSAKIRADLSGALARPVQWLSSVETLLAQGVERFICLGPGRACAHLLSKELAHRDKLKAAQGGDVGESGYEVWSLATVDDVLQLGDALSGISSPLPPPGVSRDMDRLVAD
ncbi:uncharacterized protein PFL1_02594 [Pseudozyma flocculosa PF-1]|uniref:[acyl-carrier-protein] S-malonyltransferase n=2 Tax=Pseudozyma flocculosa TaxID=84751 RepID=A0A5C3EZG4_9BASI|nr:uncharacterized protein PFL1_02594 [Pseudozyma flocculosa PF-1]EPQ29922.1 hypothetical protein PFL1_02594 [Pseudozyma flocculosa PF-1]SPO37230.1 related to Malonyl CoA-acyl carrier protein transacylase [Pseudozyma flocculosa]